MNKRKDLNERLLKTDPVFNLLNYAWERANEGNPWFTLQEFLDNSKNKYTRADIDILDDTIGKSKEELQKFFNRHPGGDSLSNRNFKVRINASGYTTLFGYHQLKMAETTLKTARNQEKLSWVMLFTTIIMLIITAIMLFFQIK